MRKNRSPAPIFFPLLHHRRQVFPLPLQNCRIPENKRKKGYPPPPMPLLSSVPPCTLLNVEFAPQTRCCIEPPPSVAVLNAYLRVHGSTSSLPRKFEVKEYTGRTFFNDDIHSGRKMVGIPPPRTNKRRKFAL